MPPDLPRPIIYLITSGATTSRTTPKDDEFSHILHLVEAAVACKVPLLQLREKELSARVLYELTKSASSITRGTVTKLLVNDRFDIAMAAGADGVQLTKQSLPARVVRETCGDEFLIGVSTHSPKEARVARAEGGDLVVFGPVFETESKRVFGDPQGVAKLRIVTSELRDFPVVAIGGIVLERVDDCFRAGASGIAAIRLLNDPTKMASTTAEIRDRYRRLLRST
jgi:thiamine-phosphate pyrophosphorylase